MDILDFKKSLAEITGSARFLSQLDVLDVEFASGHSLELYVASSLDDQVRGLSNLENIDVDGMLFYFATKTYKPFSMKDMLFDLDVGWYDAAGKLLDVASFEAGNETPVYAKYGYRYVIETRKGSLPFSDLKVK